MVEIEIKTKDQKWEKLRTIIVIKYILTNDNPRFENPNKIRHDIKKGIKDKRKIIEISNRAIAISEAIKNLNTGEVLLVAGKGHETTQELVKERLTFLIRKFILKAIKVKNKYLSNDLKLNIIKELSGFKKFAKFFIN